MATKSILENRWRENQPLYLDRETGIPTALGPFKMRWIEADERWHFIGPDKWEMPAPVANTFDAYHAMVDLYAGWYLTEPWAKVYFIGEKAEEDCRVKIGTSTNPADRLRMLQIGSPVKLQILATTRGDELLESEYHSKFRTQHRHGEWFLIDRRILAEINRLNSAAMENYRRG